MRLYLVQHGQATSKEADPDRPLTDAGRRDVEKVGAFVRSLSLRVGAIVHSGKTRAAQTVEILSSAFEADRGTFPREGLAPNDPVEPFVGELANLQEDQVVVGHLPFLAKLASALLTGSESTEVVAFRQGGIVCIERGRDGAWRVLWIVTPEILA